MTVAYTRVLVINREREVTNRRDIQVKLTGLREGCIITAWR